MRRRTMRPRTAPRAPCGCWRRLNFACRRQECCPCETGSAMSRWAASGQAYTTRAWSAMTASGRECRYGIEGWAIAPRGGRHENLAGVRRSIPAIRWAGRRQRVPTDARMFLTSSSGSEILSTSCVPAPADVFCSLSYIVNKARQRGRLQMKQRNSKWMLLAPATAAAVLFLIQPLQAEVIENTKKVGDTIVHYKTVLPNNYDPAKAYPAVLVMGGGPQNMNTVD